MPSEFLTIAATAVLGVMGYLVQRSVFKALDDAKTESEDRSGKLEADLKALELRVDSRIDDRFGLILDEFRRVREMQTKQAEDVSKLLVEVARLSEGYRHVQQDYHR